MIDDPAVLVVGAGPTGLLLACELRRRGIGCRIIDKHAAPLTSDRATVVHPRCGFPTAPRPGCTS